MAGVWKGRERGFWARAKREGRAPLDFLSHLNLPFPSLSIARLRGKLIRLSWSLDFYNTVLSTWSCFLILWIKIATERPAFLKNRFSDKPFFCRWKHIAAEFVLSTLEKYYQILRSGPWSATYDLGGITFRKIKGDAFVFEECLKIFPIHVYKFSFLNTSNTYRVFAAKPPGLEAD